MDANSQNAVAFLDALRTIPAREGWKGAAWHRYLLSRTKPKPMLPRLSGGAADFVETIHQAIEQLHEIRKHYRSRGTDPAEPHFAMTSGPFRIFNGCIFLGLAIQGADKQWYQLCVRINWSNDCWTISTVGSQLSSGEWIDFRELPDRVATDLPSCRDHIKAAITDLATFRSSIPDRESPFARSSNGISSN
jgi:hypothetical protein